MRTSLHWCCKYVMHDTIHKHFCLCISHRFDRCRFRCRFDRCGRCTSLALHNVALCASGCVACAHW